MLLWGDHMYVIPFLLTLFAGLATSVGALISFNKKVNKDVLLPISLGLSAGVMIYVSFVEIFPKAYESLASTYDEDVAYLMTTLAFFLGIGLIAGIDYLIPKKSNPHEYNNPATPDQLMRLGMFSALAIAIHNFPEGLATFIAAIDNVSLGLSIALAIGIHNIPEGIAIAMPVYHATQSKKKAFWLTFLSGFAEPVGALVGFIFLRNVLNDTTFGLAFALVAGIMVYISIDELLPTAEKYGKHHLSIIGVVAGMIIMALSLILF